MPTTLPSRIAIIGMACEFPGAHSPEALWQNVLAGRRYFRKAPPERLPADYIDTDPTALDKSYCDIMAVLDDWKFDPLAFGIAPVTFHASDMAHWLALSVARGAMADAGLALDKLDRSRIGVVLGNTLGGEFTRSHLLRHRWPYVERAMRNVLQQHAIATDDSEQLLNTLRRHYQSPLPAVSEDTLAGNMSNTIAGRICSYFDLGGGGHIVDGACSSSLLSISNACQALLTEDLDIALAGGVDVSLDPFEIVGFAKARALAVDDIHPYDARATGMLPGEGCGMFVLMREADARQAGYRIHACITGWGISSDGAGSITAPTVAGQMRALKTAYRRAGYPFSSVSLIEGHGTGTVLGDKVEISALQQLLQEESASETCHLGSIKSQIGHCKAAAGAAGLIKSVMALQRKILPPSSNCERPSAVFSRSPALLQPLQHGLPWPSATTPRRAAVSAMGFGGANAHVTLEEANPDDLPLMTDLALLGSDQSTELLCLSAPNLIQLYRQIEQLIPLTARICRAELSDLSATLSRQPISGAVRLALVAHSPWQLNDTLQRLRQQLDDGAQLSALHDPAHDVFAAMASEQPLLAALFPGQGSQFINMGAHLQRRYPFVHSFYEQYGTDLCSKVFRNMLGADPTQQQDWQQQLRATEVAQAAITAHSMAMLQVLQHFGLQSELQLGHSLGEISALAAGGAYTAATALQLARLRGDAIATLPLADPGAMLAMAATPQQVERLLAQHPTDVQIANLNSPQQTVVSGSTQDIEALLVRAQQQAIGARRLAVSHAFHSARLAPAGASFLQAMNASSLDLQACHPDASSTVISCSSAAPVGADSDLPLLLAGQIHSPVRFTEAVHRAASQQPALWLEIGPGNALSGLLPAILGDTCAPVLPIDVAGEDGFHLLNRVLGQAFVLGFPVALEKLFAHRFHRPFDLHNYAPQFIVNPCERAVADNIDNASSSNATPISIPARQKKQATAAIAANPTEVAHTPASALPQTAITNDSMIAFATDWISRRTGFPLEAIGPHTRLREDLNLDSIKFAELTVQLSQKIGRSQPPSFDPPPATIAALVSSLLNMPALPQQMPSPPDGSSLSTVAMDDLATTVGTLQMTTVAAPLTAEPPRALTPANTVMLTAVASERSDAIAHQLQQHVKLQRNALPNWDNLDTNHDETPEIDSSDLLVLLLPTPATPFFSATPEEFEQRLTQSADLLFHFFRNLLERRPAPGKPLRGLIVRAWSDSMENSADLDAGAAFINTLLLEHPELEFKWLAIPEQWTPQQWALTIEQELQSHAQIGIAYTADGQRTARKALPWQSGPDNTPLALHADDVVLVSGGASGISFELARQLARQTGAGLALLGSSSAQSAGAETRARFLQLQQEGIRYCYVQADVTDRHALTNAVAEIEQTLGKISAILHGAGVSKLHPFAGKALDEYRHCIRVKALGLFNLIHVVGAGKLKALHVISSVLGNTGMHGQIDYTYANAWLDGAIRAYKTAYPDAHCLSLGYSVWSETGLGHKLGVIDQLRTMGVTAISTAEGIRAYRQLLQTTPALSQFVITGRLSSELEAQLYPAPPQQRGRFLDILSCWRPGLEVISQATLSHDNDPYLAEHVFEGTPLMPAVMAIEAMVQVAQACAGSIDLPVLRDIRLHRALIVAQDSTLTIRLHAQTQIDADGATSIHVAIYSETDDFQHNHVEAKCYFDLLAAHPEAGPQCAPPMPLLPLLPVLPLDPEDYSPVPLFQGKLFRRITAIRQLQPGQQSLTDIETPENPLYYHQRWTQTTATPSPLQSDAALQAGALYAPPGYLPTSLGELRFYQTGVRRVHCLSVIKERQASHCIADVILFDDDGMLVETMTHLRLQATGEQHPKQQQSASPVLSAAQTEASLHSLLGQRPHAWALSRHAPLAATWRRRNGDVGASQNSLDLLAINSVMARANRQAVQQAAMQFSRNHLQQELAADSVTISHRADGKPLLHCPLLPATLDLSLSHAAGMSVALIAHTPVGIDLEPVSCRDCETWRGLLGIDGYLLALRIQALTADSFDQAATRVWTIWEACMKAGCSRPTANTTSIIMTDTGDALTLDDGQGHQYLSLLCKFAPEDVGVIALTLTVPAASECAASVSSKLCSTQ